MSTEMKRKAVHISMVGFAFLIGRLDQSIIVACCVVAFIFNVLVLPRLTQRSLERESDLKRGFSTGLLMYPLVLLLLAVVFYEKPIFMAIGWGVMAFGDGFAGVVGVRFGRHKISWQQEKSWEGFVAFVIFGWLGTAALVWAMPAALRLDLELVCWLAFVLVAVLWGAWVETLKGLVDDNLAVPLAAALGSFAAYTAWMERVPLALPENWQLGAGLVALLTIGSIAGGKIDKAGGLLGGVLAAAIFAGAGLGGLGALFLFFSLGTLASGHRVKSKAALGLAQENKGRRSVRHALSNGGVAGFCGVMGYFLGDPLWSVAALASLASATADTLASELGNVYGSRYVNILTFKPDKRGLDGVISLEGSVLGALGSCAVGAVYGLAFGWDVFAVWVAGAGVFGNIVDSVLGATLQRRGYMTNDSVNFANTALAACAVFVLAAF